MLLGYARVSTQEQDTGLQVAAMRKAGVDRIYEERASGANANRPQLWQCINDLKPGDTLVFYKLDRVARSLGDLLRILQHVEKAGATIKSLTEPIDTTTATGRLMLQILGAMAEFERSLIRERTAAGMRQAQAKGAKIGRPLSVDEETAQAIVDAYETGLYTLKGVAQKYGVSPSVVKRLVYKKTKPHYRS